MKTRLLVGALLFLIVVNLATIGTHLYHQFCVPEEMRRAPGRGGPPELMNLPEEKRQQVMELMRSFHDEVIPIEKAIQAIDDSLTLLLQRDDVPMQRINELLKRNEGLKFEISSTAVQRLIKAKAFLTPEQQRILFRSILEARPRMRHEDGFGPGGPRFRPDGREGMPPFDRFGPRGRESQHNNERKQP